jgi:plastocyanin
MFLNKSSLVKWVVLSLTTLSATAWVGASVFADDKPEFTLVIKDHQFQPAELTVPAGQKFVIIVDNQDASPEEFESHELNREKVIPASSKGKVFIGPLDAGTYPFFGDFHQNTAQGKIIVR